MIRRNQKKLNTLNILSDGALVFLAYLFSAWLWLDVIKANVPDPNMAAIGSVRMLLIALLYAAWCVFMMACLRVYRINRMAKLKRELQGIVLGNAAALLTAASALYLFRLQEFSRGVLGLFYLSSCALLTGKRIVLRKTLRRVRARGYNLKNILVIGGGKIAKRYIDTVKADHELGIRVARQMRSVADKLDELEALLRGDGIDEVVVALEPSEVPEIFGIIRVCEKCGTKTSVVPFYNDVIPSRPTIETVGSVKLIQLRTTPLDEPLNAMLKRAFDVAASAAMLVLLSPLLLVIAAGIRLSSPGPILFRQERVGLGKRPFTMLKFRSMRVNAEEDTAWTGDSDPRRTRFGSFLRKTSLDELPQLVNVLRGEMSLVGPRPEIPFFVERFRETVPLYMVKYQVRPGMTGWAQIHGLRGDTSIPDRVEHDLWYIENWSFTLDIYILLRTAFGGMLNDEKLGGAGKKAAKGSAKETEKEAAEETAMEAAKKSEKEAAEKAADGEGGTDGK